ncbi:hypothetical protein SAMN05421636_107240 [Pricia antarctica]|uniref:Tellurite resistance protein TerB n=1 Tax=Pricia antarctica TaxID=641691 RepID=A0A1G7FR67_9FLAO|nr:hypothetical protein [Pricia antarctica]SDE78378.1 hypothetical protein SAMN05421636_107240 [Pricia antarctica]
MKEIATHWSKAELKVYILLLCAKADSIEDPEELNLIRSRTAPENFDRLYNEISLDDEDKSFTKIQNTISRLEYSQMELAELKKETREVFSADGKFHIRERNLSRILDNIIY